MSIQNATQGIDALNDTATPDQLRAALRAVRGETSDAQEPLTYTDFALDGSGHAETESRHQARRDMGQDIDSAIRAALLPVPQAAPVTD